MTTNMVLGSEVNGESGFSQGRWPRQETLTLLEIRTRLHPKFQQASAQKPPLWDEVSRIMAEEHGYQRSGKKCKEKLDNLYKYYKKTKALSAKGGSHNGKHYRFFKQLEALYGSEANTTSTNANTADELPLSHFHIHLAASSDEFDGSTSSEGADEEEDGLRIRLEIEELIERQVRRLMEAQESWMENILEAVERMEQERASRDEAWRRQELLRSEEEERVWACERARIEARDAALINVLERIGCRCRDNGNDDRNEMTEGKQEAALADYNDEIAELIRLQGWVQPELEYDRERNGLLN